MTRWRPPASGAELLNAPSLTEALDALRRTGVRARGGLLLGECLGPFGLLIALVMPYKPNHKTLTDQLQGMGATSTTNGTKQTQSQAAPTAG